jgi:hypothetical protein
MAQGAADRWTDRADHSNERSAAVLSNSTVASLRRLAHEYGAGRGLVGRLAAVARMAADDAHRGGFQPERLIIALKREWSVLPEPRVELVRDRHSVLDRLVTLCVANYYDPLTRTRDSDGIDSVDEPNVRTSDVPRAD